MTEAGLAAHRVKQAVVDLLHRSAEPGVRVVVGVSGGGDSLALAAAVAQLAQTGDVQPIVVVVDHQLQPGSQQVAKVAAAECVALGLPDVRVVAVEVPPAGDGLEAAARRARHAALQQVAAETGAKAILLAHTKEDQAETVLLRLARGSGSRSLAAMQPVAEVSGGVALWRPLLGLDRATVRDSLAAYGLTAHDDPQNTDPRFRRARVRHELLPVLREVLGDGAVEGLVRSAELARQDNEALAALAAEVRAEAAQPDGSLLLAPLLAKPVAISSRVLRDWLIGLGVAADALDFAQMREIGRLATEPDFKGPIRLTAGVELEVASGRLRASRRNDGSS